jgi:hypothetical protein
MDNDCDRLVDGYDPDCPPVPVGGYTVPVNKLELLAPWLVLVTLAGLASLTVTLVRRRRSV